MRVVVVEEMTQLPQVGVVEGVALWLAQVVVVAAAVGMALLLPSPVFLF